MGLVSLCLLLLQGCSDDNGSGAKISRGFTRSVNVVTAPVQREQLNETVKAVGTARALKSVALYAESAGIVTAIIFQPDALVQAGDVLLQLDDRDEQLAFRLAQVQLTDAERLVTRYTSVNRDSANIAQSQIDSAIAAVDAARIALEQAQLNLDRRQIVAPFMGRVGITDIDVGDRIDTNTQVTTLDDRATLLVDFAVPELFVGQVKPGIDVSVELWNSGRDAFTGQVVAVDSRINENSRAFTTRAAIDNSQDLLRPGMAFEMSISVARGEFLTVPDVAVQWGADGPYVWVEDNGTAVKREVQLIKRLPNRLLIEGDILPGTPVITEGVQAVRAGVSVDSIDPAMIGLPTRVRSDTPTDSTESIRG
jgi:RND family efflux transporter MFP subunit